MRELLICKIAMRSFLISFILHLFIGCSVNVNDKEETSKEQSLTVEQVIANRETILIEIKKEYFLYKLEVPYAHLILDKCKELDPFLIASVIEVESSFDPLAISNKGAVGLMQNIPGISTVYSAQSLKKPSISIEAGCDYLSHLKDIFHEDHAILTAYNHGMGNAVRYSSSKTDYSRKVMKLKEQYDKEFEEYFRANHSKDLIWSL